MRTKVKSFAWISIEQSVMGGDTRALTTIGCLIISRILLNIGWEVLECVRMTPVKSLLNQATHSKVVIKNPNAPYMSIIG